MLIIRAKSKTNHAKSLVSGIKKQQVTNNGVTIFHGLPFLLYELDGYLVSTRD